MANDENNNKKNLEEEVKKAGEKIKESIKHIETIDHYVKHAYYSYVEEKGLYKKEHFFSEKQKEELIGAILTRLKEKLVDMNKLKREHLKDLPEEVWEEAILPTYFGVSRSFLKRLWKDKKRILKEDMDEIVGAAMKNLGQTLYNSALGGIGNEHIDAGKEYLKKIGEEHGIFGKGYDEAIENIKDLDKLHSTMVGVHKDIRQHELQKKTEYKKAA